MKSKLLICLAFFAMASMTNGQTLLKKFTQENFQLKTEKQIADNQSSLKMAQALMNAPAMTSTRTETEPANELTLAYCGQDETDSSFGIQVGINQAAINITSTMVSEFIGNKVTKIRVFISEPESIINASLWITKRLGGTPVIEQTVKNLSKGWNEIILNTAYEIDGKAFYAGMTVQINKEAYPFGLKYIDPQITSMGACHVYHSNKWSDMTKTLRPGASTALQIQCVTEGPKMPNTDIDFQDISYGSSIVGNNIQIAGYIHNNGRDIKSAEITYSINDETAKSINIDVVPSIKYNGTSALTFAIPNNMGTGIYDIKATITKINGEEDTDMSNNTRTTGVTNMSTSFPHKTVVEEGTGNWCGTCVEGISKMEQMNKEHSETFVGIAVHWKKDNTVTDPMQVDEYSSVVSRMGSIPNAVFNRSSRADIYNYMDLFYEKSQKDLCEANLSLTTKYANNEKTEVSITSSVKFSLSHSSTPYRMAYVVVEDGVTGYKQINYYNRETLINDFEWEEADIDALGDDLQYFVDSPYNMNITFNNVARAIYDNTDCMGIKGSFAGAITENEAKTHNYTIELPDNIQNKDNVRIVALLIRQATGEIINAEQVKIGGSTGINSIDSNKFDATINTSNDVLFITTNDDATAELYSINGNPIATTAIKGSATMPIAGLKGVYIIRVNNGKDVIVKKVIF